MTNSRFQKLLDQASKAAEKHKELSDKVNAECIRRFGVSYSDVDADGIIDVIDIYGGTITVEDFVSEMKECIQMYS